METSRCSANSTRFTNFDNEAQEGLLVLAVDDFSRKIFWLLDELEEMHLAMWLVP